MISASALANLGIYSLQIAAIVAGASLLPWLLRLDNPGARYAYWRAIGLLCLALPWIQPYRQLALSTSSSESVAVLDSAALATHGATVAPLLNWTVLAWAVLILGVTLRLAWLAAGLSKLRQLRACSSSAPILVDADLQCTLGTRAEVRDTAAVSHPVTFGWRKPVVLLPQPLRHQPDDIRRAVVGHELIHVKRRDWPWLIVEELVVCLFWFHPAVWWLVSRIQLAREEVVDELAILLTGRRKAYVEALLAFADSTSVLPIAAFARRRHLFRRIALVSKEDVMSSPRLVASCAAMALVVIPGTWYTVSALPLRATLANFEQRSGPGPLEQRAHAVTPENPIPRRVHAEDPMVPDIPGVKGGTVIVKVTIDEVGRIAESRVTEVAVAGSGFNVSIAGDDMVEQIDRSVRGLPADTAAAIRQAAPAFTVAALASVRQWRYDSPVEGPLTFSVPVRLGAAPEIMAFKAAGTAASGAARNAAGARGAVEVEAAREIQPEVRSVPSAPDNALRVGGAIKPPLKIFDVRPVYPPVALAANVSGVVIIEARIGADGGIEDARVLRSIPLLDEAALDAVKQWRFTPTLLNGQAVPIMMTMTVNFTLDAKR
jgi:TonB family protein